MAGGMTRIGVIRNPRSGRNRKLPAVKPEELGNADLLVAEPRSGGQLADALSDFARREVELVVVDGGDGTVREVLTALPGAYGSKLPPLSILAAGRTNLIARDVGTAGYGRRGMVQLVEAMRRPAPEHRFRERPALTIDWLDDSRPPLRGMFFGTAAFVRGTEFAQQLHRRGLNHGPAVAATIASSLYQALGQEAGEGWRSGEDMSVRVGSETREGDRFLFLATTLHRLMLGLWPFWGDSGKPIRYLDIPGKQLPLRSFAVPLLAGRPTRRMLASGFASGTADEVILSLRGPFILDGERYDAGEKGIRLTSGPAFRFVSP
jgi:hypothetical protein